MSHKYRLRISRVTTVAFIGLLTCAALGAASGEEQASLGSGRAAAGVPWMPVASGLRPSSSLQSFHFAGGSIDEFVEAIRSSWQASNIVVSSSVSSFAVPSMSLPRVDPFSLLQLLEGVRESTSDGTWTCSVNATEIEPGLFLYRVDGLRHLSMSPPPSWELKVMSIAGLMSGGYTVDQLRSSIELVLGVGGFESDAYRLAFDEHTKLLAIAGPRQATVTAIETLESIEESSLYPMHMGSSKEGPA